MATQTLAERTEILAPTGLEPMLDTAQLRAYFGIGLWQVNQWRKAGCPMERLPGGRRRFNLAEVKKWLADQAEDAAQTRAEVARKGVEARA